VGDDAQSIYSWRGADMAHILGFQRRYPGSRVFTIETNYRSVPEILDLSNEAIKANEGRIEKNLRASREAAGVKPALVAVVDPRMQAATPFPARWAAGVLRGGAVTPSLGCRVLPPPKLGAK
jgi:DNA helicase-2/ATP-dependent DNA helicase PcrA